METKRPRSGQTTVSVKYDDPGSHSSHPRIKFGAECIETKIVTTTTTTKRTYPPLQVHESRPLFSPDAKEYPLARKPTPPELAHFAFSVDSHGPLSLSTNDDSLAHQDVGFGLPLVDSLDQPSLLSALSYTHSSPSKPPAMTPRKLPSQIILWTIHLRSCIHPRPNPSLHLRRCHRGNPPAWLPDQTHLPW